MITSRHVFEPGDRLEFHLMYWVVLKFIPRFGYYIKQINSSNAVWVNNLDGAKFVWRTHDHLKDHTLL
jgi:hypothetical protein